jgi:hypothetical protein
VRTVLAVLAGAAVAALGALILGEYPFTGLIIVGAAVILGLFVAEANLAVSRQPGPAGAGACGVLTGCGLIWAAWISTGHELAQLATVGWVAVAAGAATAAIRAGWRRAADSQRTKSRTD